MLDYREPPNGDFVAFVEKIEREQIARAMQPHKLPDLTAGGTAPQSRALAPSEAQRVLEALRLEKAAGSTAGRGALIGAAIGAALIAFGLLAEGGIFLALVGAVLLWHNLRKLARRRPTLAGRSTATQQIDHAFGKKPPKVSRARNQ